MSDRPLPPDPADGRSCDWGGDNSPSTGWRWSRPLRAWLPVCDAHRGSQADFKRGNYVPDWAMVPREGGAR